MDSTEARRVLKELSSEVEKLRSRHHEDPIFRMWRYRAEEFLGALQKEELVRKGLYSSMRNKLFGWVPPHGERFDQRGFERDLVDSKILLDTAIELLDISISAKAVSVPRLDDLHPTVAKVASDLWKDGHYRQAILDTYIALVNAVKEKSGRADLDITGSGK